jgi:hypothetical protein
MKDKSCCSNVRIASLSFIWQFVILIKSPVNSCNFYCSAAILQVKSADKVIDKGEQAKPVAANATGFNP